MTERKPAAPRRTPAPAGRRQRASAEPGASPPPAEEATPKPARSTPASLRAELEQRLRALPDLEHRPSRHGDGRSYFVGDREIAHFHGDGRMDVRLTKERIRDLKDEGSLDPRVGTRGPTAEWVAVRIEGVRDVALLVALVEDAVRQNS